MWYVWRQRKRNMLQDSRRKITSELRRGEELSRAVGDYVHASPRASIFSRRAEETSEADYPRRLSEDPSLVHPTDPRWVLAIKVSEALQGATLTLDRRQRLIRLGKLLGLTPFDANLIVAIIQDQARRGVRPDECPAAAHEQLAMVVPRCERPSRRCGLLNTMLTVAILASLELLTILILW